MPDIFASGSKVFVEGENPANSVPLGEDDIQVISEGEEGVVLSSIGIECVFLDGVESGISCDIEPGQIFTIGKDPAIPSVIDPFEVCVRTVECVITGVVLSEDQRLKEWAQGKDYQPIKIYYDVNGSVTSASVIWPDGSTGALNTSDWNPTHETFDGYSITHVDSGKTVTQPAVIRNADGAITDKPELIVT
jgi:hypothetical protein